MKQAEQGEEERRLLNPNRQDHLEGRRHRPTSELTPPPPSIDAWLPLPQPFTLTPCAFWLRAAPPPYPQTCSASSSPTCGSLPRPRSSWPAAGPAAPVFARAPPCASCQVRLRGRASAHQQKKKQAPIAICVQAHCRKCHRGGASPLSWQRRDPGRPADLKHEPEAETGSHPASGPPHAPPPLLPNTDTPRRRATRTLTCSCRCEWCAPSASARAGAFPRGP